MPKQRCYECVHNTYCYACSRSFPERAETCAAFNNMFMKDVIDRDSAKRQWEKRGD